MASSLVLVSVLFADLLTSTAIIALHLGLGLLFAPTLMLGLVLYLQQIQGTNVNVVE